MILDMRLFTFILYGFFRLSLETYAINMEKEETATVGDLITYLEENLGREDRLCYWHEGGAWMECEYVSKADLGKWMFYRAGDMLKRGGAAAEHEYRLVEPADVVIY